MHLIRTRDVALTATTTPWAFRPGDFFTKDRADFVIKRTARAWLLLFRRRREFIVYGRPLDPR